MRRTALLTYSIFFILGLLGNVPARAGCPAPNALYPMHCYGRVTWTCTDGVATFAVKMEPGYLLADFIVYTHGGQTIIPNSILATPTGWKGQICGSNQVTWGVPSSRAVPQVAGFKVKFNSCTGNPTFGLHVVPVLGPQQPYIPPGVQGPTYTFYASAGCSLTPSDPATWGRLKSLYR